MKTTSTHRPVLLGIFITVGIIILALGLLTMAKKQRTFGRTITAKALFADIAGLKKGDNIRYSGVKVGIIRNVVFVPGGSVELLLSIEEASAKFIPQDALAKVGNDGFIGSKILQLYGGKDYHHPVNEGHTFKTENTESLEDLIGSFGETNKNLVQLTSDLKIISHKLVNGEGVIGKMINDSTLYTEVRQTLAVIKSAGIHADKFSADLGQYTAQLQQPGTMTYDLLKDTVIFARLRSGARQIDDLTTSSRQILQKLKIVADKLSDTTNTAGLILQDPGTAREIRSTLRNLQSASEKLDENMDALKDNFLLRGYFKRKEKQTNNK